MDDNKIQNIDSTIAPALDSESLGAAVLLLIQLVAELEEARDPRRANHVDAKLFRELFALAGTEGVLKSIIERLNEHRKHRGELVARVRIARCVYEILAELPHQKELPPDADRRIRKIAKSYEVELTDGQVDGLLEAARRQEQGDAESRPGRVYRAIADDRLSDRTVWGLVDLVRRSHSDGEDSAPKIATGKIKTPEQLEIAWHDGVTGGDCLEYVLKVIGADAPDARTGALKAWNDALMEQLDRRSSR